MSDIYIYILVVLITAGICSLFGVFYVSKVISNQRRLENEIIETTINHTPKCIVMIVSVEIPKLWFG